MSIKDMINQAYAKDASEFEKTFASVMSAKMDAALEAKFDDMFGSADNVVEEEPESESEDLDLDTEE